MKRKRKMKRMLSLLLGISLTLGVPLSVKAENNGGLPDTIKMPVSIYDHLNDGLLFEYPLDGGAANGQLGEDLSMYTSMWGTVSDTGISRDFNLIEDTLGSNKTPVYTKEAVEKVASIVKNLMDSGYNGGKTDADGNAANGVYNQLYRQITGKEYGSVDKPTVILPEQSVFDEDAKEAAQRTLSYKEMGWHFEDADGKETEDESVWKNAYNDHLVATEAGATATFSYGELEAGTYVFKYYSSDNMDINLFDKDTKLSLTESENNTFLFTINSSTEIYLKLVAGEENADFCHDTLSKAGSDQLISDNNTIYIIKEAETIPLEKHNITTDGSETNAWRVGPYGIFSSDIGAPYNPDAGKIFITQSVAPSKTYELSCINEGCHVSIKNGDEVLAELHTTRNEEGVVVFDNTTKFSVPDGVSDITIEIEQDARVQDDGYRGIKDMKLTEIPTAKLGTYETSKVKYSNKDADMSNIETCMDYAYYMLNNLWTNTGDITKKTNCYTTLTLQGSGDGYYSIDQNNLVYDLENKNIYKDPEVSQRNGFFPLDQSVLGEKNDLADFPDDEIPFGEVTHNYHFATKAHTQFIYQKGMQFTFVGDDDVYLFINGKKVLDLGGAHSSLSGTVDLDTLKLTEGEVYDMDFFHLERHTLDSNFAITTNITINTPKLSCSTELTDEKGNVLKDGASVPMDSEIGIRYNVTAGSKGTTKEPWMEHVTLIDDPLGVYIGMKKDDAGNNVLCLDLSNDISVKDKLVAEVIDEHGKPVVDETTKNPKKVEISAEDLNNNDKIKEFVNALYAFKINKDQTVSVSGLYKNLGMDELVSSLEATLEVTISKYDDDSMDIKDSKESATSTVSLTIMPENTPKAAMKAELTDKAGKALEPYVTEGTDVYVQYTLTAQSEKMKGISIKDAGTGIEINKDGIIIPEGYDVDGEVVITLTKDGRKQTLNFTRDQLNDGIKEFDGEEEDAWILNTGDTIRITGIRTKLTQDRTSIETTAAAELKGPVFYQNEETKKIEYTYKSPDLSAGAKVELKKEGEAEDPTNPIDPTKSSDPAKPDTPSDSPKPTKPSKSSKSSHSSSEDSAPAAAGQIIISEAVPTGDTANIALYIVLIGLALGGILVSVKYVLKSNNK